MIIDTEKVKETLFNENIPVRRLAKDTGIGASTISQLRLETLEKVQDYINETNNPEKGDW